jgi:hypothetical protein
MTQRSARPGAISTRFLRIKKARHRAAGHCVQIFRTLKGLFYRHAVLIDAGIGAAIACLGALTAMVVVMFFTLFGAQAASLYARSKVMICVFRVAQQQAGAQCANVCTVAVRFDTPSHHGRVFFIQTGGSTGFAGRSAVQQDLYQLAMRTFRSLFLVFHNSMRFLVHQWISLGAKKTIPTC